MKNFRPWNLIFGWTTFLVASFVYLSTIEPTASLWDCGEYIATAFKLQVGHPPGAPFYQLLARAASLFAGSDPTQAAKMVNALSGLASALTIMFLYWTIVHLARKLVGKNTELSLAQSISVIGAGLVGAFAYMFSDTFWFSAVEGEVYATSSLFTALVFWAILKWENVADEKGGDRWIILIAFLMGISIGVHLLNLLAIPAIIFVYYFRKNETVDRKGFIIASVVSVVLLAIIMYGIILGVFRVSAKIELMFVNTLGMPYNTGVLFHLFLLIGLLIAGVYFTQWKYDKIKVTIIASLALVLSGAPFMTESVFLSILFIGGIVWLVYYLAEKNRKMLNILLLSTTMILLGYSSYTLVVVRSYAGPPIDENNPENVFALVKYIAREQYGDRPLAQGQYYNAPILETKETRPNYIPENGKYVVSHRSLEYVYDDRFTTVFPRMWSAQADHQEVYKQWGRVKGKPLTIGAGENSRVVRLPSFGENIRFFVTYQMGFMYWRYFMWNFAGRQNDIQGTGGPLNGNWLSGISFIDTPRLGPQEGLPDHLENNKGRNTYYMLPLLLGLAGLFFQANRKPKDFWVVLLLFIMTGLAIVIYLNQYPNQPRERDYAYAGSFYAFAIWIGLGVLAIIEYLKRLLPEKIAAITAGLMALVLVPAIMAIENWDDHDRSNRYTARDIAYNYLNTCEPNAILCTNGDNDTFPLWYIQEVEGVRTDVRVVNMMLFNTEWYIDQMKNKAYHSDPLPIKMDRKKYLDGTNNQLYIAERISERQDLKRVMDFVADDNPATKLRLADGREIDYLPARKFSIPFDSSKYTENNPLVLDNEISRESTIDIDLTGNFIMKSQMMMLDLLANNNWERPIYYVAGGHEDALGLEPYFYQEGFAHRVVPIRNEERSRFLDYGGINIESMYQNYMEKFSWGNMEDPDVYLDYYTRRTLKVIRLRNNFARLAIGLLEEGKRDSAMAVVDRCMELLPAEKLAHDIYSTRLVDAYFLGGNTEKANLLMDSIFVQVDKELRYYYSLPGIKGRSVETEKRMSLQILQELLTLARTYNQTEQTTKMEPVFAEFYQRLMGEITPGS